MLHRILRRSWLWTLVAGALVSAQAPEQPRQRSPAFYSSAATAVVVDVIVRDGAGRPVVDLGEADFEIFEDDEPQAIGSFQRPVLATAGVYARQQHAARVTGRADPGRGASAPVAPTRADEPAVLALVFDQLSLEGRDLARRAALRYIGSGRQTANVIGLFDVQRGLVPIESFTQDATRLRAALDRAARPGSRSSWRLPADRNGDRLATGRGPVGASAEQEFDATVTAGQRAFRSLEADLAGHGSAHALIALATALELVPGRKALLLFSEGLSFTSTSDARFHSFIELANRANLSVYGIDAAGLRAVSPQMLAGQELSRVSEDSDGNLRAASTLRDFENKAQVAALLPSYGLGLLSTETGGFLVESTNDLGKAFRRVDEDSASYYTLTYTPTNRALDGTFRRIAVKVRRPGLSPRGRSGYRALPPSPGVPVLSYEAPAVARLEAAPPPNDFAVHARGFTFPGPDGRVRVPLIVSWRARSLESRRDAATGRVSAEAVVVTRIRDSRGAVVHKASQQYSFANDDEKAGASTSGEVLFFRQVDLEPGVYAFEAIVFDAVSQRSSVRIASLDVPRPEAGAPQLGGPFLVRRVESVDAQSRRDANPLYFGTLLLYPNTGEPLPDASPAELTFAFETRAGGRPITGAAVELRRGGAPLVRLPLPLSPPDEQGRLQQVSRLAVEGMTPGAYELHVIVEAGPSTVSRSVSFTVVGDRGRAPLQPQPFRARVV